MHTDTESGTRNNGLGKLINTYEHEDIRFRNSLKPQLVRKQKMLAKSQPALLPTE